MAELADAQDLKVLSCHPGGESDVRVSKSGRVAKLADAAGLKLADRKRSSGFDSQPGHQSTLLPAMPRSSNVGGSSSGDGAGVNGEFAYPGNPAMIPAGP